MRIAIDAGHGGNDPGAVYAGRQEKDDNLKLALSVGEVLRKNGVEVFYTRDNDIYETPGKKARDANDAGADYFISFHRNSSEYPDQYSGAEVLVYEDTGARGTLARNILEGLAEAGYEDLGVDVRRDLTVLKRTKMPAVLIETGFINTDADNEVFDDNYELIVNGIAEGILKTVGKGIKITGNDEIYDNPEGKRCECNYVLYRVQVGAFRNRESAERILNSLIAEEFPAYIVFDGELYKVQVGAYRNLSNAIAMENRLRQYRYNTYITTK